MAEESDGIAEAFEGQLRVLVTAAGQVGERIARAREDALRRAQAASEREARELRTRFDAEQRTARTEYADVYRSDWWERSTPEQIGRTYQTTRAWAQDDPEAARAEERMREELRTRYGVDAADTGADAAAVRAAVERAEQERAQADVERHRSTVESVEAQQLLTQADQQDRLAEQERAAAEYEPDPEERTRAQAEADERTVTADAAREDSAATYDSSERRASTAAELESKGIDQEVIATRMRADVSQAKPATAAVAAGGPTKAPKARKARSRGVQVQRSEQSR
ncbi:hypothetical protein [uncultured Leifsonia sp.]|uniref:hypothetical protein n=1 Tax=uncultured Leifsonia sp. TaxID=340359 RepID=UPI0025D24592|nr:hypothetical protein [uncultured Leifsonia sp.]